MIGCYASIFLLRRIFPFFINNQWSIWIDSFFYDQQSIRIDLLVSTSRRFPLNNGERTMWIHFSTGSSRICKKWWTMESHLLLCSLHSCNHGQGSLLIHFIVSWLCLDFFSQQWLTIDINRFFLFWHLSFLFRRQWTMDYSFLLKKQGENQKWRELIEQACVQKSFNLSLEWSVWSISLVDLSVYFYFSHCDSHLTLIIIISINRHSFVSVRK